MIRKIGVIDRDDILNCPFCGSPAIVINYIIEANVYCTDRMCGVSIKASHAPRHDTGIEEAIEKWNRRVCQKNQ